MRDRPCGLLSPPLERPPSLSPEALLGRASLSPEALLGSRGLLEAEASLVAPPTSLIAPDLLLGFAPGLLACEQLRMSRSASVPEEALLGSPGLLEAEASLVAPPTSPTAPDLLLGLAPAWLACKR